MALLADRYWAKGCETLHILGPQLCKVSLVAISYNFGWCWQCTKVLHLFVDKTGSTIFKLWAVQYLARANWIGHEPDSVLRSVRSLLVTILERRRQVRQPFGEGPEDSDQISKRIQEVTVWRKIMQVRLDNAPAKKATRRLDRNLQDPDRKRKGWPERLLQTTNQKLPQHQL